MYVKICICAYIRVFVFPSLGSSEILLINFIYNYLDNCEMFYVLYLGTLFNILTYVCFVFINYEHTHTHTITQSLSHSNTRACLVCIKGHTGKTATHKLDTKPTPICIKLSVSFSVVNPNTHTHTQRLTSSLQNLAFLL